MIGDPALRKALGEAAWQAGQELPRWPDTAEIIAAAAWRLSSF
jgi:hypothetical protein